jgi:hypothetical protein
MMIRDPGLLGSTKFKKDLKEFLAIWEMTAPGRQPYQVTRCP